MKIYLETKVAQSIDNVFSKFNGDLFKALAPPFPPVKLLEYGGEQVGDRVVIELNFIFFKQKWVSVISENNENENIKYFVDEGVELPFFLKKWKHKHIIKKSDEGTLIIDDIEFSSPFRLLDYFLYPFLWLQFMYRKPVYRRIFGKI